MTTFKKLSECEIQIIHGIPFYNGSSYSRLRSAYLRRAKDIETHTEEEWMRLCEYYDYKCCNCGGEVIGLPTKDHIIPPRLGGTDSIDNIQPLCRQCNTSKGMDIIDYRKGVDNG